MALETLQEIGSFGLEESIDFAHLESDEGDGYDTSALIGSSCGTREWRLNWKLLPQTEDSPINYDGLTLSRADYLWEFFCKRKREGNSSFIVESPVNGQNYLAKFVDRKLTYSMFMMKLFTTGLALKQRREPGVTVFDPLKIAGLWGWYAARKETDFDDDEEVDTISDFSGNDRHLLVVDTDEQAIFKTDTINSHPVFRWGADNEIAYQWTAEAPDNLTLRHALVVAKATEETFAVYRGLLTAASTNGVLTGNNGTANFFSFGHSGVYEYRKNNIVYPQSAQAAPMDGEFGVMSVSLDPTAPLIANTLQVGADRDFADRYWLGDVAEIFIFSQRLRMSALEELNEYLMVTYGIS